jgi:hypothetical protein
MTRAVGGMGLTAPNGRGVVDIGVVDIGHGNTVTVSLVVAADPPVPWAIGTR